MRDLIVVIGAEVPSGSAVAKKLRAEHFYCKLMASNASLPEIMAQTPGGIILAGEEKEGAAPPSIDLLSLGVPVLALGSSARSLCERIGTHMDMEPAVRKVLPVAYKDSPVFCDMESGERWIEHAQGYTMPEAYRVIADGDGYPLGFLKEDANIYLLQFQIERNDPDGMGMLIAFADKVCGCEPWWIPENIIDRAEQLLRDAAGQGQAVCAMSGGLDSTVAALLAKRALGDRVRCVFIDTGLMREGEPQEVERYFRDELTLNFSRIDASAQILRALSGLYTMQEKWRVIEHEITRSLLEEANKTPGDMVFIKGTNYVDVQGGTHQEDIQRFPTVVEPLRELFKNEIRQVGESMSLSPTLINRQPFPGMGLAARIHGEVTAARLKILRTADAIFEEELTQAGQEKRLTRYFTMLDQLEGQDTIIMRATQGPEPSMTAARLPYDLMERTTHHIQKELPTVMRVLYDMTPGKAEW